MVTRSDIAHVAKTYGLADKPLEIHSSLSSFGNVEGGADAVVDGLLDTGATVVVPTFSTSHYAIPQPLDHPELCFERNALAELVDEKYVIPPPLYDTSSDVMNTGMGAIPRAVLNRVERVRGNHALNSFSALGPKATQLISTQTSEDVYGPFRYLVETDAVVVMMGVDLNRMTLIHYAEQVAGRNLFRRWVQNAAGEPVVVNIGSCSNGFERLASVIEQVERKEKVGNSIWRIYPVADVVALASKAIVNQPEITRCDNENCARCPDAIAGGPILP